MLLLLLLYIVVIAVQGETALSTFLKFFEDFYYYNFLGIFFSIEWKGEH